MSLLKHMKAAVLAGIAGVLVFAGGAFAAIAIEADPQTSPVYGTPSAVKYTLKGTTTEFGGAAGTITLTLSSTDWVFGTSSTAGNSNVATPTITATTASMDIYVWPKASVVAGAVTTLKITTSAGSVTPGFIGDIDLTGTTKKLTIQKATPAVTWPTMKTTTYNVDKRTLEGYSKGGSGTEIDDSWAAAKGSATYGANNSPVAGTFHWVDESQEILAVTEAATNGRKYAMVFKPTTAANFKNVYSSDPGAKATTTPDDDHLLSGKDVYFRVNQKPLEAANIVIKSVGGDVTVTKFPNGGVSYSIGGVTVAAGNSALVYTNVGAEVVFDWKDANQGQGTLKPVTYYMGVSDFGTVLASSGKPTTSKPTNVGEYDVYVKVDAGTGNYKGASGDEITATGWKIKILPRPIKISVASHTKVYDNSEDIENPSEGTGKVTAGFATGADLNDASDFGVIGTQAVGVTVTEAKYVSKDVSPTTSTDAKKIIISAAELKNDQVSMNYKLVGADGVTELGKKDGSNVQQNNTVTMLGAKDGITKRPVAIATGGHVLTDKVYDGDSLINGTDAQLVFEGIQGDDKSFAVTTDFAFNKAFFESSKVGDSKLVTAGTITLQDNTLTRNYTFANKADSTLSGKNVRGNITPKTLTQGMLKILGVADVSSGAGLPYTGSAIELVTTGTKKTLSVTDPGILTSSGKTVELIKESDYTISYEDNINAGVEATVTITPVEGGNYAGDAVSDKFKIIPKVLTVAKEGHEVADRFYEKGNVVAPVTKIAFDGLAPGETLKLATEDEEGDYSVSSMVYGNENASASPKGVLGDVTLDVTNSEVAKNYTFASGAAKFTLTSANKVQGMVYKMPLVITAVETEGRVYNGSDAVTVKGVTLATVENQDDAVDIKESLSEGYTVTGAKYASASAGTEKQIAEGTVVLKGTFATNYEIPDPSLAGFGSDEIEKRELSISVSGSKIEKPYDGMSSISPDNVKLAFTAASGTTGLLTADREKEGYTISDAAFEDELIGTKKTLASGTVELTGFLAENYTLTDASLTSLTGTIGKGKIPVRGVSHTKVYNGNVSADGVEFSFDPSDYPLWQGDVKEQLNSITWAYTSKNAGTKTIKPSATFKSTAPAELRNYYEISNEAVEMSDGGITKRPLAFTSVSHTKPYDGTTTAKITNMTWAGSSAANGLVSGDATSTVVIDSVIADYISTAPGTKEVLIKSVALKGTNGLNYDVIVNPDSVITLSGTPAGITGAPVTISKVEIEKTYDGTNTVSPELVKITFAGIAPVDTPFTSYLVDGVTLSDKNAGTKTITGGTVTLFESALVNYTFASGALAGRSFTAKVNQKLLTVTGAEHTKPYDGNTRAAGVTVTFNDADLLDADVGLTVDSVQAQYTSALPGTKTLKINKVFYKGGNYASDTLTVTLADGGITGTFVESINVKSAGNVDTISGRRTLQFTAEVLPTNASVRAVDWSVSDSTIATVNASGLLTSKRNGRVTITATAKDGTGKKGTFVLTVIGVGVAEANRDVPNSGKVEVAAIAPVKVVASGFTAGPSPVRNGEVIKFFSRSNVKSGSLYIFDQSGNSVAKVAAKAGTGEIGSWKANASEGTYIVKGALVGKDGTREKVSFVFAVTK